MRQTRLKRGTEGMRLQALALGAVGGLACLAADSAHAQSLPAVDAKREWHIGARAEVYYDSNISRTDKSFVSTRAVTRDDYVFTPAITASIVQPFGRQALFLNGDMGYAFYRNNSNLDRRRGKILGGVSGMLGPCRPVAFGGYEAAQSDLANLDLGTSENLRETTTIAAGMSCSPSAGFGGSLMFQRADSTNSAISVETSDSTTETASLSLGYSQPTLGSISLGFSYSDVEYPNRIIPGRPIGDGLFSQSYFVAYNRQFGSKLSVSGNVGLTHLKREFAPPGVEQSLNSTTYGLDVVYGLGRQIDLELHASRSLTPSQQVGKSYDQRTDAEAAIRYRLGTRITVTAGYSRQETESNTDTASALLVVTDARTNAVFGAISFAPNDRMSFELNARHEEREANLPQFTYSAVRVGVSAQTSF